MKRILSSIALAGVVLLAGCDRLEESANANSELKLRGFPLSCRVEVGPLGFLPSSASTSFAMLANDQAAEWEEMARAYMEAGQLEEALAIANKMDDYLTRELTLAEIAGRYAEAGNDNRARQVADSIEQFEVYKARALARIARAFAVPGNNERAAEAFAEALQYARSLDAEYFQPAALGDIAVEYAAAGQFEEALQLANEIEQLDRQFAAKALVAGEYAAAGQFERAVQLAATIEDNYQRRKALEKIAANATVPQLERLVEMALAIEDDIYKSAALADLALQYIAADSFDRAWSVAQTLVAIDPNGSLLPRLAGRYAAAGQFERAEELAGAIANQYWQSSAWVEVVGGYAAAGEFELAIELADSQESVGGKIRAKRAIAQQYAEAGEYARALELVETIEPVANTAYEAIEAQFVPLLKCALGQN